MLLLLPLSWGMIELASGQIFSDLDIPFTEEDPEEDLEEVLPESTNNADLSESIELVPAPFAKELNLPTPKFRIRPWRLENLRHNNNQTSAVSPPAWLSPESLESLDDLISPDYLFAVASTHSWGRFNAGAWKKIRVIRESPILEDRKKSSIQSTADYVITLSDNSPAYYKLTWESSLSGAGRRWNAAPKSMESNFWDESVDLKPVKFVTKADLALELEGVKYPCHWEQITFENLQKRVEVKTWRSDSGPRFPQILRQERKVYQKAVSSVASKIGAANSDTVKPIMEWQFQASSIYTLAPTPTPYSMLGKVHQVWKTEQEDETASGKILTTSLISLSVPGEVISFQTRQLDTQGQVVDLTSGMVTDFGVTPDCGANKTRKPLFNFRAWRTNNPLLR